MTQEQNNTSTPDDGWTFQTEEEIEFERVKLNVSGAGTNNVLVFSDSTSSVLMNITPYRRIQFYHDNKEVGWVDFSDGDVKFGGNMDESATAFFNAMKPYILQQFTDAKQQFMHDINDFMSKLHG